MSKEEKTEGEEKKKADEGAEAASAKGSKGKIMKLAIIGAGIVLILGGAFTGWILIKGKGGDNGTAAAKADETAKDTPGHIVTMDPFIINLADPGEVTYLKIAVNLEVDSEKMTAEIQKRMPQIRDAILMLLSSKTADDVKSTGGKLKLQDDIVLRINNFLQTGKIKAVYFTEFVMQ